VNCGTSPWRSDEIPPATVLLKPIARTTRPNVTPRFRSTTAPGSSDAVVTGKAAAVDSVVPAVLVVSVMQGSTPPPRTPCQRAARPGRPPARSMPLPGLHDRPDQRFRLLTGQPHRAGTAADAAGGGRLVLYAADRRRAAAAGAPLDHGARCAYDGGSLARQDREAQRGVLLVVPQRRIGGASPVLLTRTTRRCFSYSRRSRSATSVSVPRPAASWGSAATAPSAARISARWRSCSTEVSLGSRDQRTTAGRSSP
jgi:hypothetical protein